MREAAMRQKRAYLSRHPRRHQQPAVRHVQHQMIAQARELRLRHRHRSVVGLRQRHHQAGYAEPHGARDRARFTRRSDLHAALDAPLRQRTPRQHASRPRPDELLGRERAGARAAQQDDSPRRNRRLARQQLQHHQPAQAVADEVDRRRRVLVHEPLETLGDLLERDARGRIGEQQRLEPACTQAAREQRAHRTGHPQAVYQNDLLTGLRLHHAGAARRPSARHCRGRARNWLGKRAHDHPERFMNDPDREAVRHCACLECHSASDYRRSAGGHLAPRSEPASPLQNPAWPRQSAPAGVLFYNPDGLSGRSAARGPPAVSPGSRKPEGEVDGPSQHR